MYIKSMVNDKIIKKEKMLNVVFIVKTSLPKDQL